ncbi:MAG: nitroreductase family protein [Desulfosudaceae bacterium]
MLDSFKQAYLPEMHFPERHIDESLCTRCGRCYQTCPCYGYRWEKDEVPVPVGYGGFEQACINCGNCLVVCPTDAIIMSGSYDVPAGRYQSLLEKKMAPPEPLPGEKNRSFEDISESLTETERVIYTRRSNRLFKDKEVPPEMLTRLLEAGRFAPSAGNNQPYKFIVMTSQPIIRELERRSMTVLRKMKNMYLSKSGKRSLVKTVIFSVASYFSPNKMDPRPITAMEKADVSDNKIFFDAPAVILILKDKRGISNPDLDVGICAQNMVLAAHSLGLGTCYVSLPMEPLGMPLMAGFRRKIGIPSRYKAVTSIAVGYPRGKIDKPVKRDTPPVHWI